MKIQKFTLFLFFVTLSLVGYSQSKKVLVNNTGELEEAIKEATPGTIILLANGVWENTQILFRGIGSKEKPIVLGAETPGKVTLEGESNLKLAGEHLIVQDLIFTNGYSPDDAVIEFRIDTENIANHSRVTNCIIRDFSKPNRDLQDLWVQFWGRHNQLDHSYLAGKFNAGPTVRVALDGNEHIKNYHKITNNHFGPRPRKGGPKAETIQIGSSETSMAPSFVNVANNYFEECNGEVEIISNKSSFNEFRNNVFFKSEGSLVLRHGNYCIVDGNIFIGDGESPHFGGIRVINTGHLITNNYFYNLRGDNFRSPLAVMNGIPKSPLNRYNQVTDVVVAFNTWVNSPTPWHFGVGANMAKDDILPPSEIRSARPERMLIANNIVYNSEIEGPLMQAYDKIDGITFRNNIVNRMVEVDPALSGVLIKDLKFTKVGEFIMVPSSDQEFLSDTFPGFEFEKIQKDIFEESRIKDNRIGAFSKGNYGNKTLLTLQKYGPEWFEILNSRTRSEIIRIDSRKSNQLQKEILSSSPGDIIELGEGIFELTSPLLINKKITIRSKNPRKKAALKITGASPAFELGPGAALVLENVKLQGTGQQIAFATLKDSMCKGYNLKVKNTELQNFTAILKAYKGSFADEIIFKNSRFDNFIEGVLLNAETDDLGDYNAEFVTIKNCVFNNIQKDVLDFYRGGYDESTIGGNLFVTGSTFKNSGGNDDTEILLKTRGIVNVKISHNEFIDNPVELIALLWGEKGNIQKDNEVVNSGKFVVEEYLKQKLVY